MKQLSSGTFTTQDLTADAGLEVLEYTVGPLTEPVQVVADVVVGATGGFADVSGTQY